MDSTELIRGTLKMIILHLLSNNNKMYGYEITKSVKEKTKGKIRITEGALYPALHGLFSADFLTIESITIGKRVRKYYKLTKKGKVEAKMRVQEYRTFIETIEGILN